MGQLTKNFHLDEFKCKDGTSVPLELRANIIELAVNLQVLRDYLGKPISINSAYRTPSHNKWIKAAKNSYHVKAMAADIKVEGFAPKDIASEIEHLIARGRMKQGGLKAYATFVHYDIRGLRARW